MYITIEQYIDAKGDENCDSCPYYHTWSESHPYGATFATEDLWECNAPYDNSCPYVGIPDYDNDDDTEENKEHSTSNRAGSTPTITG